MLLLIRAAFEFGNALETEAMIGLGAAPGLVYHMLVYFWAKYCGVSVRHLRETKSYELSALVSEYTMRVDNFVDGRAGRNLFLEDSSILKRHRDFKRFVSVIAQRIQDGPFSSEQRKQLVRTIQSYRRNAFSALLARESCRLSELREVLAIKEQTTGLAIETFVKILNIVHGVSGRKQQESERLFPLWTLALQVSDDVLDLDIDYQTVPNIIAAILCLYPEEKKRVERELQLANRRYIGSCIRSRAPSTYDAACDIVEGYIGQMMAMGPVDRGVRQMTTTARALFRASTSTWLARGSLSVGGMLLAKLGSHHEEDNLETKA